MTEERELFDCEDSTGDWEPQRRNPFATIALILIGLLLALLCSGALHWGWSIWFSTTFVDEDNGQTSTTVEQVDTIPYIQFCFMAPEGVEPIVNIDARLEQLGLYPDMLSILLAVQEDPQWSCGEVYPTPAQSIIKLTIYRDNRNPAFEEVWVRHPSGGRPTEVICSEASCVVILMDVSDVKNAFSIEASDAEEPPLWEQPFDWSRRNIKLGHEPGAFK